MKPAPLSSVLADDLLLDRVGARLDTDDELGSLLLAVAHRADIPVPRASLARKVRRHRGLTVLAALGVAVSGATVAAAVEMAPGAHDVDARAPHSRVMPPAVQALVLPFLAGTPYQGRLVLPFGGLPVAPGVTATPIAFTVAGGEPPAHVLAASAVTEEAMSDRREQQDQQDVTRAKTVANGKHAAGGNGQTGGTGPAADGSSGAARDTDEGDETGQTEAAPESKPAKPPKSETAPPPNQANQGTVPQANPGNGVANGHANGIANGRGNANGRGASTGGGTGTSTGGAATSQSSGGSSTSSGDDPASGAPAKGATGKAKDSTGPSTTGPGSGNGNGNPHGNGITGNGNPHGNSGATTGDPSTPTPAGP